MDNQHAKSILTVALMAAFADGLKDERERESIRKLAEVFGTEASIDLAALYRDVLLARPDLAEVVKPLDTQGLRQYAYEMAVGVVNADGSQNPAEAAFLAQLAAALQLPDDGSRVRRAAGQRDGGCCRGAHCSRVVAWRGDLLRRQRLPWRAPCSARQTSATPKWTSPS